MAANRSSRPKRNANNMLIGLENLIEKPKEERTIKSLPEEKAKDLINLIPTNEENNPVNALPNLVPAQVEKRTEPIRENVRSVPNTGEKKIGGRPRKYGVDEDTKVIGVKLRLNEVSFLEEYGGKFGGKTGYVTYLIHKEMERLGVDY